MKWNFTEGVMEGGRDTKGPCKYDVSALGGRGLSLYMYDPKKNPKLVCCRLSPIYVDWHLIDSLIMRHEETFTDKPV